MSYRHPPVPISDEAAQQCYNLLGDMEKISGGDLNWLVWTVVLG